MRTSPRRLFFVKSATQKPLLGLFFLFASLFSTLSATAQEYLWKPEPALGEIASVEDVDNTLYFVSYGGLFSTSKDKIGVAMPIGRKEGLSDNNITASVYSPATKTLFVYYLSGNIDLISAEKPVRNVSAIVDNLMLQDKSVSRLLAYDSKIYIAGGFGVSRLDPADAKIDATYHLFRSVKDVARIGEDLYVLTAAGQLMRGNEQNNLQDPAQWERISLEGSSVPAVKELAAWQGKLLLLTQAGKTLYSYDPATKSASELHHDVEKLSPSSHGVIVFRGDFFSFYPENGTPQDITVGGAWPNDISCNSSAEEFFAAKGKTLQRITPTASDEPKEPEYSAPSDNRFFSSLVAHGQYYSVGGGRTIDRSWIPGSVKIRKKNGLWQNITWEKLPEEGRVDFLDIISIAVDPADSEHYFAASWGEGLYEFREGELVKRYSLHNSPLASAVEGSDRYVRVSSLVFDSKGTLWMGLGSVRKNIYCLTKEGEWHGFEHSEIAEANGLGKMIVLSSGTKWVNVHHRGVTGSRGVFIFNDNGTPGDTSDDKSLYVAQFSDRTGKNIETNIIYDLVLDKIGAVWVGSNKGPIIINNPEQALKSGKVPVATRPVGGKEPNLFYILDNVPVTAIAVDEINNKWIATQSDGLYLLNADGSEILAHYTRTNSPLISNSITTLALDGSTGTLFVGTDAGLVTFRSGSTAFTPEKKREIHAYPNPLRPEDPDLITITDLAAGVEVKIVDTAGSLIFAATASGETLSFNARLASGERIAPGIYHVLAFDPRSKQSHNIRIAVVQ